METKEQYKNIIESFYNLGKKAEAIYYTAEYYDEIEEKETAIKYYEEALKYFPDYYKIYGNLARLYADVYIFGEREKQFYYVRKAYEMNPNDMINLFNMLLITCKFNEPAEKYFQEAQKFNPNGSVLFSYGCYLIHNKNFQDGFKLYRYRIEHDSGALPDGLHDIWQPNIDITDKTILVSYEQGFGDTLMFIRFVKYLKCKEIKILVQDGLYDLLKSNFDNVYKGSDRNNIEYDYFVPMMDVPLLIGLTPDTIDQKNGYLKVDGGERLESNKYKVGICFAGSKDGVVTCRDIPLEKLYPLFELDCQFYLFQKDDIKHEIPRIPEKYNVINLASSFNSWLDTAKYMKQMDLMITVDCGVLNLAGALGVNTWALFNKYPEFRWFSLENDIGWYDIKPYQCKEFNGWEYPVECIKKDLQKVIEK